ncbi:BamA/TamA family outer membrane protein [Shewanella gaetbuli]
MNRFCKYLLAALPVLIVCQVNATSFTDPIDGKFDMGDYLAENAYGFLPVPILLTEPALGVGGGVAGVFLHESEAEKQHRKQLAMESLDGGASLITPAITIVGGGGTENGTWFGFGAHRQSFLQDRIRYTGLLAYGNAELEIYNDLGGLLPPNRALSFDTTTQGLLEMQKLQFRVADTKLFLGIKQQYSQSTVSSSNPVIDKLLSTLIGSESAMSGLGINAEYDTRNNIFFPNKGFIVEAEYMAFRDSFGSDYNYDTANLSGEVYVPINKKWTWAFAGDYQYFNSDTTGLPPTLKPYVNLRGVAAYRYQGDNVIAAQTQLMYHIDNRWTVSGFYGVGRTSEDAFASQDKSTDTIDAYGVGFRYSIARRYGLQMGVDIAFSGDDSAIYFQTGIGF